MASRVSKYFNLFLIVVSVYSFESQAVTLTTGKEVSQESFDKVTQAIAALKKDETFIYEISNHEVPPFILTEGIYALGQACKDGCTEMTLEEFKKLISQEIRPWVERYEADDLIDQKSVYLYNRFQELKIIDKNNQVNSDDGAVLKASLVGRLDQHFYGLSSRGYDYRNPELGKLGKFSKKLLQK